MQTKRSYWVSIVCICIPWSVKQGTGQLPRLAASDFSNDLTPFLLDSPSLLATLLFTLHCVGGEPLSLTLHELTTFEGMC